MSDESKKPIYKQWWLYLVAVIVVAAVAFAATSGKAKKNDTADNKTASNTETKSENSSDEPLSHADNTNPEDFSKHMVGETDEYNVPKDSKVTIDNFNSIKLGDSYDNVVALLGDGEQVGSEDGTTDYKWSNNDKSVIAVTFNNNVVIGKIQTGLNKMNCSITLAMYDEISEESGTYDDMVAKLGKPQVMAENKLEDIEYVTYEYVNTDESRAEFTVSDGMIVAKDQTDLK